MAALQAKEKQPIDFRNGGENIPPGQKTEICNTIPDRPPSWQNIFFCFSYAIGGDLVGWFGFD